MGIDHPKAPNDQLSIQKTSGSRYVQVPPFRMVLEVKVVPRMVELGPMVLDREEVNPPVVPAETSLHIPRQQLSAWRLLRTCHAVVMGNATEERPVAPHNAEAMRKSVSKTRPRW